MLENFIGKSKATLGGGYPFFAAEIELLARCRTRGQKSFRRYAWRSAANHLIGDSYRELKAAPRLRKGSRRRHSRESLRE